MTKRTFNLLTVLLVFTGCNFFNSYQLPDNYVAIKCEQQDNCIEIDNTKILKEPILKIEYASATLNGKKQMMAILSDQSKIEVIKLYKDNLGKNIAFFHKESKLSEMTIHSDEVSYINLDLSQIKQDVKEFCVEIVANCSTASYDADQAEMQKRAEVEKNLRAQYTAYESIQESHSWKSFNEDVTIYASAEDTKGNNRNVSRVSLLQEYDLKQDKFVYKNFKIKTGLGWIDRTAVYPMNIVAIKPILERNFREYKQQLKCLDANKMPEPYKIVSTMKRSTEIALTFLGAKEFENYSKQIAKQLEGFKCQ
jgi:hypothetical protein